MISIHGIRRDLACAALFTALIAPAAHADWPSGGVIVLRNFFNSSPSHVSLIRDGNGDVFLTARRGPSGFGVRVQRVSSDGVVMWESAGVDLHGSLNQFLYRPATVPTGEGGMLHAGYGPTYTGPGMSAIYLNRVDGAGQQPTYPAPTYWAWIVANAGTADGADAAPAGGGDTWVAWKSNLRVRLQRRLADGALAPGWSAFGRLLATSPYTASVDVEPDGAGGALVLWVDDVGAKVDRILADTTRAPGWPAGGRLLAATGGSVTTLYTTLFDLLPSGPDHWIAVWIEYEPTSPSYTYVLRAQRFGRDGAIDPAWPTDGLVVLPAQTDVARWTLLADGTGGVHVLWEKAGQPRWTRLLASGAFAAGFDVSGVSPLDAGAVYQQASSSTQPLFATPRPGGGIVFVWNDTRAGTTGRARWLTADGMPDPVESEPSRVLPPYPHGVLGDGADGGWVACSDAAPGETLGGLKLHRFLPTPTVGVTPTRTPARLALAAPRPQPARGSVTLRATLATGEPATVTLLDVSGRRVRTASLAGAGVHEVRFDDLGALAPGVYLASVEQGTSRAGVRVVIVN